MEQSRGLGEEELRDRPKEEFGRITRLEEVSWRQKSRNLWLADGDGNTRFFHRMVNARRICNFMGRIRVGELILDSEEDIWWGVSVFCRFI